MHIHDIGLHMTANAIQFTKFTDHPISQDTILELVLHEPLVFCSSLVASDIYLDSEDLDSALHVSSLETTVILLFYVPLLRLQTCLDSALHGSSLETIVALP
jgi:hypothetical protein